MRNAIKQFLLPLRNAASRFVNPALNVTNHGYVASPDSILKKAAEFIAVNKVEGDYLEFGVFKGASFISAYYTLRQCFDDVIGNFGFTMSETDRTVTASIFGKMRFFAFDSFEGLPAVVHSDSSGFFEKGQFSASLAEFKSNLTVSKFPSDRGVIVSGWYDRTLTRALCDEHHLTRAAIVHIDCDLYESTRVVLEFIAPLLVDGTILIFDDWFHFNGHPHRGEQRAFNEWTTKLIGWSFTEYQQEGTWRKSFIANKQ